MALNFSKGAPSKEMLKMARDALSIAADEVLGPFKEDLSHLLYAPSEGSLALRQSLAQFLSDLEGVKTLPDNLIITGGAAMALDSICTLYTKAGDTVIVCETTYHLALETFRDHGLTIKTVKYDEVAGCMDLDDLTICLSDSREGDVALVYTNPTFQNPRGGTMSLANRQRLVALAYTHEVLVVADEPYRLLWWDSGPPPPPLGMLDVDGRHVVTLGSFSKILAPGLRLGYFQCREGEVKERLKQFALTRSGGGASGFTSALVSYVIVSGMMRQGLVFMRSRLQDQCRSLTSGLETFFPKGCISFSQVKGGYFVWVKVHNPDLYHRLLGHPLLDGKLCGSDVQAIRLCFAHYEAKELYKGIELLTEKVFKTDQT